MGVYDRAIETAKRLIKAKGQLVTWRVLHDADVTDKDWRPTGKTETDYPVSIVFIPKGSTLVEIFTMLKGSDVPTTKLTGLMPAVSFNPVNRDLVIRSETEFLNLKSCTPFAPNGQIIFWQLEFEG